MPTLPTLASCGLSSTVALLGAVVFNETAQTLADHKHPFTEGLQCLVLLREPRMRYRDQMTASRPLEPLPF